MIVHAASERGARFIREANLNGWDKFRVFDFIAPNGQTACQAGSLPLGPYDRLSVSPHADEVTCPDCLIKMTAEGK